jgi:hypothetical protein
MFIWDFAGIIALSVSLYLSLVIGAWLFYSFSEQWGARSRYLCPFCAHLFIDYTSWKSKRCPCCRSYLEVLKGESSVKKALSRNNSGMVLMTVLMIVMVMMIMTITILTQSLNQSTSVQKQIDQIKEDQLAKGIFWKAHSGGGDTLANTNTVIVVDGKPYNASIKSAGNKYTIDVSSQ